MGENLTRLAAVYVQNRLKSSFDSLRKEQIVLGSAFPLGTFGLILKKTFAS